MGMIKLPENSINYFKSNLDEIFKSGNLAEGQWNKRLGDYVKDLTSSQVSVCTNSNGAGYGIIKFKKDTKDVTFECWPRYVDVTKDDASQFLGWPITISLD